MSNSALESFQMENCEMLCSFKVIAVDLTFQNDYACQNTQATVNIIRCITCIV